MKALFLVYTPFQFLVAQQIIHSEGLKDSVLVAGYVGSNTHFIEIYDFMSIEEYWSNKYIFPELPSWDGLRISGLVDAKKAYKNYQYLKSIAKENNVDTIFISDNQNQASRFTAVVFSHLGYKIAFYEEGLAHYVNREYTEDHSLSLKIKIWLRDFIYYLPIYHVCFASWRYRVNKPLNDSFPYDYKYSIIPVFNGAKEMGINIEPVESEKTKKYFENVFHRDDRKDSVLLLTEPLKEVYTDILNFDNIYFDVIKKALLKYKDAVIYIKFHPREEEQANIKRLIKSLGYKYVVLSEDINLPVELFLQHKKFSRILFFGSSTFAYNGYLYQKQNFECLLQELNDTCKKHANREYQVAESILKFFDDINSWCPKSKYQI